MKKLLLILLLLLFTNICYASLWAEFYPKNYIDLSTIQHSGRIVTVWTKELNPGNWQLAKNKKIWFAITKYSADCIYRKIKIMNLTNYDLKGNPIENFDTSAYATWDDVIPDSVGEVKYNYFCSLK